MINIHLDDGTQVMLYTTTVVAMLINKGYSEESAMRLVSKLVLK